ncbi:MAG: PilZ domain-containing protein [Sphingomicrobium sp.]
MPEPALATMYVVDSDLPWPEDMPDLALGPYESGTIVRPGGRHVCAIRKIAAGGALLRTELAAPIGEKLALELPSGLRRNARIELAGSGEIGIAFDEPIDIVALINRNLVSQPAERRSMPRVEMRARVHVKWAEHLVPATMRNISSTGIQVEGDELPPQGTLASLFVEGINLPAAEAVWRRTGLAGFEFFEEVSWSSLIAWVREASCKA